MVRESCAPPRSTDAPWAVAPAGSLPSTVPTTTYASTYAPPLVLVRAQPIRKNAQHDWTSGSKFEHRSTAQESFQGFQAGGMRPSCKPHREWEPTVWPSKPSTTNSAMFIPHYGQPKRVPFRPVRKEVDGSKFDTKSTQQESFQGHHQKPRASIYPVEKPYEYQTFDHTSTSRAAFVEHYVPPFVAAQKPKPSMGADGMMA